MEKEKEQLQGTKHTLVTISSSLWDTASTLNQPNYSSYFEIIFILQENYKNSSEFPHTLHSTSSKVYTLYSHSIIFKTKKLTAIQYSLLKILFRLL